MTVTLIGLSGRAQSGKSTTAHSLAKFLNRHTYIGRSNTPAESIDTFVERCAYDDNRFAVVFPFAYELRSEIAHLICTPTMSEAKILADLWHPERKFAWRSVMQFWGTELRRDHFGEDYWINKHNQHIDEWREDYPDHKIVVIVDDVRFKNEAQYIKDHNGLLFRLESNPEVLDSYKGNDHRSETELDELDHDPRAEILPWEPVVGRVIRITNKMTRKGVI